MNWSVLCVLGGVVFLLLVAFGAFVSKKLGDDLLLYAAVILLVAIVVISALMVLGPNVFVGFSTINQCLYAAGANQQNAGCATQRAALPAATATPLPWWQFWGH